MDRKRFIVGITGASGALYAQRVIECILAARHECHLAITPLGQRLLHDELGLEAITTGSASLAALAKLPEGSDPRARGLFHYSSKNVGAAIGSGSFLHDGMVVVPCSARTLNAIAAGVDDTLVARAAACALKERRKLILAHREAPLTLIDIRAMETLTLAGAIVCPANPGFYLLPRTVGDVVDFVAARLLDLLGCEHSLKVRWDEHANAARGGDADE